MSLILLLRANEKTRDIIKILGIYTDELDSYIKAGNKTAIRTVNTQENMYVILTNL